MVIGLGVAPTGCNAACALYIGVFGCLVMVCIFGAKHTTVRVTVRVLYTRMTEAPQAHGQGHGHAYTDRYEVRYRLPSTV